MPRTPVGDTVIQYLSRYPKVNSTQLARILHRDEPALFYSEEQARCAIRRFRGASGEHNRKYTPNKQGVRTLQEAAGAENSGFGIPTPLDSGFSTVELPKGIKRWLILADVHVRYHDVAAIETVLRWVEQNPCDGLLLNGDILDCYSLSRWSKDPREVDFEQELEDMGALLDIFQSAIKPRKTIWKCGNHEYRLERYLMSQAAELFGLKEFTLDTFLGLTKRKIQWVDHGIPIYHHALTILHGDEYAGGVSSPVNPARGIYLKAHDCALVSHGHRTSEHTGKSVRDVTTTCWSTGCLCDLHPKYMPLNQWNHGFAVLDTANGWKVENYRIVNGEVV